MKDVSIGQYYVADSPVHRLDPRIKLILTIAYIVLVFFLDTFFAYGVTFMLLLLLTLTSRIPILNLFRSLRAILFLLAFTLILTVFFYRSPGGEISLLPAGWFVKIYPSALKNSGMLACRLVLLVMGPSLLTLTTTPVELTDAIERLLKPLSWIKFPVHEFAMIMSIALRLIPTLSEETTKIISAQKARCADFESGNLFRRAKALLPILIPLFVSSFRRADELADAMDSRCYRGAKNRTRMKVMKVKLGDGVAFLIVSAVFFCALLLRYDWWGWVVGFRGAIV